MIYDINFVLPISASKDIYLQRIKDFKKFGIMNVKDKKVLITFLVGRENIEDLDKGWTENVDVEVYHGPHDEVVQKVYHYFSNLKKARAKWTAKIDDDSINDVNSLFSSLEENYAGKMVYVCCFMNKIDHHLHAEKSILIKLGYENWLTHPNVTLWHEWEASFLEDISLNKILQNEKSIKLLQERSLIPRGVTDACLAFAARIAGIYPVDSHFTCQVPIISKYSFFGGPYSHLHFISRISGGITQEKGIDTSFDFMRRMIEKDYNQELYEKFVNQEFLFLIDKTKPEGIFTLKENGIVSGNIHENESLWIIKENKFYFMNQRGFETGIFDVVDGKLVNGKSLISNAELSLRKIL